MSFRARFRQGMIAAIPIWIAFVPSSLAWGIAAQAHGLSLTEIVLMSAWVYSGPAQFAVLAPLAGTDAKVGESEYWHPLVCPPSCVIVKGFPPAVMMPCRYPAGGGRRGGSNAAVSRARASSPPVTGSVIVRPHRLADPTHSRTRRWDP